MYRCLLCGHGDAEIVNVMARNDTPQTSVACTRCAFVQVDPMPSAAELATYYADGSYRREFPPLPVDGVDPSSPDYEAALDARTAAGAEFINTLVDGGPRLEIGCGDGRMAKALNACAVELDPGMAAKASARGVPVTDAPEPGVWRLVYALQVLEHQPDPVATLRAWRDLLADDGVLHVQVPTLERMYGGASHFFQWPHVCNFTSRTLYIALRLAGFDDVSIMVSGAVLGATARKGAAATYDEVAGVAPVDDVPALIEAHERQMRDVTPGDVERWVADAEAPRPSDLALRHALVLFASMAQTGMDGVARISQMASMEIDALDGATSQSAWVLGFQAGAASTHQRYQQATAHLANALRVRAMKQTDGGK